MMLKTDLEGNLLWLQTVQWRNESSPRLGEVRHGEEEYALFTPFALFIFWGLNGYLLGMEYFQLAAMRREGRAAAMALRRKHRLTIWAAGVLMAMPLSVPLVNLLIPILGAATFTHIYHAIRRRAGPSG